MSDVAIKVEHLSKQYRIGAGQAHYQTLRESLTAAVRDSFRKINAALKGEPLARETNTIWALDWR